MTTTENRTTTMNTRRLLRWASAILGVLGTGHLVLTALMSSTRLTHWLRQGVWATVPLTGAESPLDMIAFWSGLGSFAVPLILLACLVWRLAGRGEAVPAGIGWALLVWCTLAGVILVASPYFAGSIAGALIVLAARARAAQPAADQGGGAGLSNRGP
jgi:hypothetical protein